MTSIPSAARGRSLLGDVARYVPGLVVPIAAGTLSTIVFARIARPDELGTFLLLLAFATTLSVPFGHWLHQAVLRLYPIYANRGLARSFQQAVLVLGLVAAAACAASFAVVLSLGAAGIGMQPEFMLPALGLAFFPVASTGHTAMLQARFALRRYTIINTVGAVGKLALPLILLSWLPAAAALLWGTASVLGAMWLGLLFQPGAAGATKSARGLSFAELRQIARESLGYGGPLTFSEVGAQVLSYSDRWAIGLLLGPAAVGLYSTNYSIAEKMLLVVQGPLIYAAHSQIVSAWENGDAERTRRLIAAAIRWLILLGIPLVAFSLARGEMVSSLLLGADYASGHVVIPIAAGSILLYAASQYGHKSFELSRTTWVITTVLLSAAAVNLVAVITLTLAFGYLGGALATAIGYSVYAAAIFAITRRRGPFAWQIPWSTLSRVVVAATAASAVWLLVVPSRLATPADVAATLAGGLSGLVVYAALVVILGELPRAQLFDRTSWYKRSWARAWAWTEKAR